MMNYKYVVFFATAAGYIVYKLVHHTIFHLRRNNKIIVIENVSDWNIAEEEILTVFENSSFIGIDCEWVTVENKRQPVALLQLATDEGFCVLIRLCGIPVWYMPPRLSELLCNRNLLKVGVGVFEDARKLFSDYCLSVYGLVDLRHIAKDLPELRDYNGLGLKTLAKAILGEDLTKSHRLRCSDWEADALSQPQIMYAADDAIISAKMYSKLKSKQSWNLFSLFGKTHFTQDIECYIDVPFKQSDLLVKSRQTDTTNKPRVLKTRYSKPRQKTMYDNCKLEAPDGELLCSCDKKKAEWYIYKGLGEMINESPLTVRLNFEPSGRPKYDDIYYTKTKVNCCVVCGAEKHFHRKQVVPSEYRRYFPDLMKKYLSHDVLLLCVDCHKRSNILDQNLRQQLAVECDAPLSSGKSSKYTIDHVLSRVKSAARALLESSDKIPHTRKQTLEKIIQDYYSVDEVTTETLKMATNVQAAIMNKDFACHGLKVYHHACANGGLMQFEKRWRQHFLDTMRPKFLPVLWSVEHNHERLAIHVMDGKVDFDMSILGFNSEVLEKIKLHDQNYSGTYE